MHKHPWLKLNEDDLNLVGTLVTAVLSGLGACALGAPPVTSLVTAAAYLAVRAVLEAIGAVHD